MPSKPLSPCPAAGCPKRVVPGEKRCADHALPARAYYDDRRGTSAQRGYGATWRKLRLLILHRDPLCKACGAAASAEVDHVVPKRLGGTDAEENLQGLCKPCHSVKTANGDGGFGRRPIGGSKSAGLLPLDRYPACLRASAISRVGGSRPGA